MPNLADTSTIACDLAKTTLSVTVLRYEILFGHPFRSLKALHQPFGHQLTNTTP